MLGYFHVEATSIPRPLLQSAEGAVLGNILFGQKLCANLVNVLEVLYNGGLESLRYHSLSLVCCFIYVCKPTACEWSLLEVIETVCEYERRWQDSRRAAKPLKVFQVCLSRGLTDADPVEGL